MPIKNILNTYIKPIQTYNNLRSNFNTIEFNRRELLQFVQLHSKLSSPLLTIFGHKIAIFVLYVSNTKRDLISIKEGQRLRFDVLFFNNFTIINFGAYIKTYILLCFAMLCYVLPCFAKFFQGPWGAGAGAGAYLGNPGNRGAGSLGSDTGRRKKVCLKREYKGLYRPFQSL